jgi:hypothetical protein
MQMTRNTSNRKWTTPGQLALAALMAATIGLGGCGQDENTKTIEKAKRNLETLAATNDAGLSKDLTYDKVISDLASVADSKKPGQAAAARLVRSLAYLRQADESASAVIVKEREARRLASSVRGSHDQWLDLNAQAQALRNFDAEKGLKQLDEQLAAKAAESNKTKEDLARAQQELKSLQDQQAAAQQKSRAQRDRELDIRGQMIAKTQTERADLIRQANEAKRTGDGFDMEAANLLAQANRQIPAIAELELRQQRLEAQKTMLEASKKELERAVERSRQQADRALKGGSEGGVNYVGAQQVAEQLRKSLAELDELRAGIGAPSDEAARLYDQALSEVTRAKSGAGAQGGPSAGNTKLQEASVHHAKADLLLTRARGLESYAGLLKLLAETKPALADSAKYASESDAGAADAKKMLEESQQEFSQAKDLYEQAGSSQKVQEVKDRLEQIAGALTAFAGRPATEPAQPEPGAEVATAKPEAAKPGDQTPSQEPKAEANFEGEKAAVFEVLQKLAAAMKTKDHEAMVQTLVFRNAQQQETFRKVIPVLVKEEELNAACVERFGSTFDELFDNYLTQLGADASEVAKERRTGVEAFRRLETMDPGDLEIAVQPGGTDAEVTFKSARTAEPVECMKVDGAWKVKLDFEMEHQFDSDSFLQMEQKVMETITENIKNGQYAGDSEKMIKDFIQEFRKRTAELFRPRDENK